MTIVAIGGSAGALDALRSLFSHLPAELASAFIVVVHIPPTSASLLAQVIGSYTALAVREAVDKLPLAGGTVHVAPPDYHLLVERDRTISLSRDAAIHFSRPAIDPMFESVADAAGPRAIAVLLTGSNDDGAAGVRSIKGRGGRVAIQDPTSAQSPEMPRAGLAACTPDLVGSPDAIGRWLASVLPAGAR